ncbi:hypothetical protein HYPSUDRAFT_57630 [Hypholoma sublateritium FD-334 SS-4]|uniref:Uncharacterized protein n=1 Tax=Hypholoma sublateritium (strain FD-334 SS-4) TaxID=945553 RepID=A0A0D2NEZ2_HYPSF|nr:hypothetical protein HYPSUDRAFT_57630 [Hypholoma sublateritium FD-334 SS-4]
MHERESSLPQGPSLPDGFEIPEGARAMFEHEHAKKSAGGEKTSPLPMPTASTSCQHAAIGEMVEIPIYPPPTEQELLEVHAEVESLRKRYGMSYRAACELFYHQQLEIAKRADEHAKAWENAKLLVDEALYSMKEFEKLIGRAHEHHHHVFDDPMDTDEDIIKDIAGQPKKDKGKGKARDVED